MKEISIIVPFYNSEVYLARCVESLCRQTISKSIELVFVDDCSTDGSTEVINRTILSCSFDGDVVIKRHTKNSGSAIARKTGIDAASGRFILFCDSDDWMELDMCENLLTKAEQDGCEIVVCDYNKVFENKAMVIEGFAENYFQELLKCTITGALWNKLIKRSLFTDHDFIYPTFSFCEDYVITIQASYFAKKIGYVHKALYNYAHNTASITQSKDKSRLIQRFDEDYANFILVETFIEKHGLLDLYKDEIIFHKLKMKNYIRSFIKCDRRFLVRWRNTFPELNRQVFHCKYIGVRLIISYYATLFGLWTGK